MPTSGRPADSGGLPEPHRRRPHENGRSDREVSGSIADAEKMIADGSATGGMIPKLQNLISLLQRGVKSAHIISGNDRNPLLAEVFTDEGTRTMVSQ